MAQISLIFTTFNAYSIQILDSPRVFTIALRPRILWGSKTRSRLDHRRRMYGTVKVVALPTSILWTFVQFADLIDAILKALYSKESVDVDLGLKVLQDRRIARQKRKAGVNTCT
jgi:hypothetical protein